MPEKESGGMTLRVYRVQADGRVTTVRERREIEPAEGPAWSTEFPPCSCPLCGEREGGR
ncbi:hypothetical protein [Streptomyces sp. SudanB25_2051]|uniref:hypothetical protein n=1 Tax=Streptomyces sp. SudanB25_2051 TaxID=3035275 RepID=UPI003F57C9FB